MTALLHAELLKLRTTRTFIALALTALATSLALGVLSSILSDADSDSVLTDVFTSDTSSLFILILAVVGISGEWRHKTITSSLLAAPNRIRFLAAKTLAFAAAGLVLSLVISVVVAVVAYTILAIRDVPTPEIGDIAVQILRNAQLAALLGALGVGIGALVRNQVVAIVSLLIFSFVVEPTVVALAPEVGRFGPFGALSVGVQDIPPEAMGMEDVDVLSPALATLAMLGWIGAAFAAGGALLRRRDLH